MKDEDIDFSDIPELGEEFWERAVIVGPDRARQSHPDAPRSPSPHRPRTAILTAAMLLTGCATLLNSDQRTVSFSSIPAEAEIWIGGAYRGTTPFSLELDNHANQRVPAAPLSRS